MTPATFQPGDYVALSPSLDWWARGARYGEVIGRARVRRGADPDARPYLVRLHLSGAPLRKVARIRGEHLSLVTRHRASRA